MLDFRNPILDPSSYGIHSERSRQVEVHKQAINLFSSARNKAAFYRVKNALLRRKARLFNLENIADYQIHSMRYGGIHAVMIDQICGSLGRTEDFDDAFYPMDDRVRDRWVAVAMVRFQGLPLDAVQLIQIGSRYFVQDGHHRISVARALGQVTIDAEIIIWEVSGQLPWEQPAVQPPIPVLTECNASHP